MKSGILLGEGGIDNTDKVKSMCKQKKSPAGSERGTQTAMGIDFEGRSQISLGTRCKGFVFWIIGLLVSLAPLAVSHFGEFLSNGANLFLGLFGDIEIFFVCVSMLVSASCEIYSQQKNRDVLNGLLLSCIVIFALLYAELKEVALTAETTWTVGIVTMVSLVITLLLGIVAYFIKKR